MKNVFILLRQHISALQIVGFLLANIVGLFIVLLSVQFYNDVKPLLSDGGVINKEYIVVSKRVSMLKTLSKSNTGFSQKEIDRISKQEFTKSVGEFTPSHFQVTVGISFSGSNGLYTALFFESVPDKYLDIPLDNWTYNPESNTIPIVIPRSYLNLYNFGFSQSNGLPKLSESSIKMVSLDVQIRGKNGTKHFNGNIVGFSDRINTILVPENFIEWANKVHGRNEATNPNRLIIEMSSTFDENAVKFFQDYNYEVEENALNNGKTAFFLRVLVVIVLAIGLIISALSFFILILSVMLLIEKNNDKIENLYLIGYSSKNISLPYQSMILALNLIVTLLTLFFVNIAQPYYAEYLNEIFTKQTFSFSNTTILVGFSIFCIISILNSLLIRHKVNTITKVNDKRR